MGTLISVIYKVILLFIRIVFEYRIKLFQTISGVYMQSVSNSSLSTDHNSYNNEMGNVTNASLATTGLPLTSGLTDIQNSPTHTTMISSQILGTTPLSQIGCSLPLDQYSSKLKTSKFTKDKTNFLRKYSQKFITL